MPSSRVETGKDILYQCPRCNLKLSHTVLAVVNGEPARIRCNTCKSERNYRRPRPFGRKEAVKKEPSRKHHSEDLYQQKIKESIMKDARVYSPSMEVELGDVIQHSNFGKGVVLKLIPPDRMEIVFPRETKTLVCKVKVEDDFFNF